MRAKDWVRIALFAALTWVAGTFTTIPIGPIPVTLQTLVVNLSAILLSPGAAALAMVLHAGLKLLLQGPSLFFSPSFGFVLGFVLAACAGSYLFRRFQRKTNLALLCAITTTAVLPYVVGLPWMHFAMHTFLSMDSGWVDVLRLGVLPFLPGDVLKIAIAFFLSKLLLSHGHLME